MQHGLVTYFDVFVIDGWICYNGFMWVRLFTCWTLMDVTCVYKGAPMSRLAVLATANETTPTARAPGSLGTGGSAGVRGFSVLFPFLPGE